MKVIFLGTNGWYDTKTGNTICILIETEKEFIILDAGNGFYKIDQYIKGAKPIYLFLSHFHLDHICGLHILDKFKFPQGINLYGPPKSKEILSQVIKQPFTVPFKKLKTKIKIHQISSENLTPLNYESGKLLHSSDCYGYRFLLENKILTYCTDTGICDNLYRLAKNADLLITECSYKSGQTNKLWPHLNPEETAWVAKKSKAKKLVLTHFDASLYLTLAERQEVERKAGQIFKNTSAAWDGLKFDL